MNTLRPLLFAAFATSMVLLPVLGIAFSSGAPASRTGAPGDAGTCNSAGCHNSFALNSGSGSVTISGPASYQPGEGLTLTLTVTLTGASRFGFEVTAQDGSNTKQGTWTLVDANTEFASGNANYVTHDNAAVRADSSRWTLQWNAPDADVGTITFYAAGNAANGNGTTSGDHIYTTAYTLFAGNAPPIAHDDEGTTEEDTPLTLDVLTNDEDPEGQTVRLVSVAAPAHGTAVALSDGRIHYAPEADYFGPDSLVYTIDDPKGATASAMVRLTVTPVNDPPSGPVIASPALGAVIVVEGDPATAFEATWTASMDPDGDALTYTWQLADEATFAAPLLSTEVGAQTRVLIDYGSLAALLTSLGVGPPGTAALLHRVVVSDGTATVAGAAASLTLQRGAITHVAAADDLPQEVHLAGNYPNPFNPQTQIRFALPRAATVTLAVYDAAGQHVATLFQGHRGAGWHQVTFPAQGLAAGVYYYRLMAEGRTLSKPMLYLP